MNTLRVLLLSTVAALALGACGKRDNVNESTATDGATSTTTPTDPAAASSPHQQEATGAEAPPGETGGATDPAAASTPSQQEATQPPPQ